MRILSYFFSLLFLLLVSTFSFADPIHADAELDRIIFDANSKFLDAHFDEGIELLKEAAKTRPDSPAVSYFLANGYWWKIFRIQIYDKEIKSTEFDDEFDDYLQQTMDRSELLLKRNRDDVVGLFYLGNAYSLKSRLKGLRGSYFSAGRDAGKGKKYLEQVIEAEPTQYDAYYNLGVYNYFAGTLPGFAKVLKTLFFLPGGDKEKGLTLLKIAGQKSGYFGKNPSCCWRAFTRISKNSPWTLCALFSLSGPSIPETPGTISGRQRCYPTKSMTIPRRRKSMPRLWPSAIKMLRPTPQRSRIRHGSSLREPTAGCWSRKKQSRKSKP